MRVVEDLKTLDVIYHFAAITDMEECNKNKLRAYDINYLATIRLAKLCDLLDYKPIIVFPSSFGCEKFYDSMSQSDVYKNYYFYTKWLCEVNLRQYTNVVIVRFPNPYGKWGRGDSVVTRFIQENPITVYGDGSQTRDFVYVRDLCEHLLDISRLTEARSKSEDEIVHIGTGQPTSINELIKAIEETSGVKKQVNYEKPRDFDVQHPEIKADLVCTTSLLEGLKNVFKQV